jgi:hypothetical protein
MADSIRDLYSRIVTSAPPPLAAQPLTWEDMMAAWDRVTAAKPTQDRWVIGDAMWAELMRKATPEERAELESLCANGTLVVSSLVPDRRTAWRISGVAL